MITRNYYEELLDIKELPQPGKLLDLGAGNGRFAIPFDKAGWKSVLVDTNAERLAQATYTLTGDFEIHKTDLVKFLNDDVHLYDIIIANNVLPFLGKGYKDVLKEIKLHLRKGGVFIGVFFGEKDAWKKDGDNTEYFHDRQEALDDLKGFDLINFQEIEAKLALINGNVKQWHRFEFIAKKL